MWLGTRRSAATILTTGVASLAGVAPPRSAHAVTYADYMLHLINIERRKADVDPVVLGDNGAAQRHADMMIRFCHAGHWGIDGLDPHMRYSLAGGYQRNAENTVARNACYLDATRQGMGITRGSIVPAIHTFVMGLMESPGHKRTMLDKWHKKVNIGLSWDAHNIACVNQFEGDYVHFSKIPAIEDGRLFMVGRAKNGISLANAASFIVWITYDPPPGMLTLGQLIRAGKFSGGSTVGYVVSPNVRATIGDASEDNCPTPYDFSEDVLPPILSSDVSAIVDQQVKECERVSITAPTLHAYEWKTGNDAFVVDADISPLLSKWGSGIYTIMLHHVEEAMPFSMYSIFYGVEPPAGY